MKEIFARYLELFPEEKPRLRELSEFFRVTTDPRELISRKNFMGHVTASGFVLSPDSTRLAVVNHKTLHRHLQPGGHVEELDLDLIEAAKREIIEETGIAAFVYLPFHADAMIPIDIDSHAIPANPRKNEDAHWHHDFRYLFRAVRENDPALQGQNGEGNWSWRPLETAIEEDNFKIVVRKLKTFLARGA